MLKAGAVTAIVTGRSPVSLDSKRENQQHLFKGNNMHNGKQALVAYLWKVKGEWS